MGIEPTFLGLSSQSGACDHSPIPVFNINLHTQIIKHDQPFIKTGLFDYTLSAWTYRDHDHAIIH